MFEDVICVIPARGGSKRIPHKNMVRISGVPLVGYSIRAALQANIPSSNIFVTSDDQETLDYSRTAWRVYGHRRPAEISTDTSVTEDAVIDVIQHACPHRVFKTIILLQPTSPIRFKGRVAHALNTYFSGDYDSLVSTTSLHSFFWYDRHDPLLNSDFVVSSYIPKQRLRGQDMTKYDLSHFENGNIYITDMSYFISNKCRLGDKVCIYDITEIEGIQIDTPLEMEIIEHIISANSGAIMRMQIKDLHT